MRSNEGRLPSASFSYGEPLNNAAWIWENML